jgi:hypothetical protein
MNWFEDSGKFIQGAGEGIAKAVSDPRNLRRIDLYGNAVLSGIGAGIGGLANNPYIGGAINNVIPAVQSGINAISAPSPSQLAAQANNNTINYKSQEAGQKVKQSRASLKEKGNIQDLAEAIPRNLVETAAFAGGLAGGFDAALEEIPQAIQGKGFHPLKRYNETYAPYIDNLKHQAMNNIVLHKDGTKILDEMPDEIYKNLPDAVKSDILKNNKNSQFNYDNEFKKAEQTHEDSVVQDFLKFQVANKKMTPDQAVQVFNNHKTGQGIREVGMSLADPLLAVDAISGIGKGISKQLAKATSELQVAQKGAKQLKEVSSIIDDYGQIPTKVDKSIVEQPIMSQKIAQVSKPIETQKVIERAKVNATVPDKIQEVNVQKQISEIQNLLDNVDNKDAAEIVLQRTKDVIKSDTDAVANKLYSKLMNLSEDVPTQPNLVSTYTPPKVGINHKGELTHLPEANLPPVEITFRNPFQKVMYEMSMPYNKAIAEGYGMEWKSYSQRSHNITKSMVEPLAELIAGNQAPEFLNRVKSVLGGIGSEIAKFSANNPGKPIIFDELMNAKKLDGLLSRAVRPEQVKRTLAEGVSALSDISREERRISAIERYANIKYNKQVDHFINMGLPEDLAEEAAPFYMKLIEDHKLVNTRGIAIAGDREGTTAGKAMAADLFDDPDMAINVDLHEDMHVKFDYIRATTKDVSKTQKLFDNILKDGLGNQGKKYLNDIIKGVKGLKTAPENILDEMTAYYVQTKNAMQKGVPIQNSVMNKYQNLIMQARNGDDEAANFLDNMESMRSFVLQNADQYEQNLVSKLQNTKLPDGTTAWDKVNQLDPTDIKGTFPGEKYGKVTNLGDSEKFIQDSANRINRMKELMGDQQHTFRGAFNYPSTGKMRVNYGSMDQMYGPGAYTSTNPAQAFGYTGLGPGETMDAPANWRVNQSKGPDFRSFYPDMERPLFWDEQVPLDIVTVLEKSKNPVIQDALEALGGIEGVSMYEMGEFVKDIQIAVQEAMNPLINSATDIDEYKTAAAKAGPLVLDEIYKKAGYDGFIGPNTDEALGVTQGGYEVVPFEAHQLHERTDKMRAADVAAKLKKSSKKSVNDKRVEVKGDPEIDAIIDKVTNSSKNNTKRIGYHINQDKK